MGVVSPRDEAKITKLTNKASELIVYDPDTDQNYGIEVDDFQKSPTSYDISASNQSVTLPSASGASIRLIYKWSGGDGTYKLTFTADGSDTIEGLSPSVWEGEGSGIIVLVNDGSSDWTVERYCDCGDIADSGSDTSRKFKKNADGSMEQYGSYSSAVTISTGYLGGFRSTGLSPTFGKAFYDASYFPSVSNSTSLQTFSWLVAGSVKTTTTFNIVATSVSSQGSSTRYLEYSAFGRWRA